MARGSYQAGSVSVNLNANSAQYVQALKHAQQITNACLSNMSQTFKHFASTAMQAGATVGRVTAQLGAPLVKSAAWGAGALATYTGVIIAHRLEQQKLAIQYGATAEQMNQMAYVANYAGVELEDVLDAMKEFSIKAGDAVEAGEAVTNTMSAFYKAAGGAQMWNNETSPVIKLNKLREAFQKLSDSDKLRVLDEAGDAGLRLNGVLRLTNQEMDMLQKTGAATATAANMTNMQTLIAKFGYLQQVGNDFLMGIVGRIAPVLIKVVDQWTNRLRSAFEDKGGFKEGFQSYVDLWSKRIFDFLMDTINSVAKFVDGLNNVMNTMQSMTNSARGVVGGVVSKQYDNDYAKTMSKEDRDSEVKYDALSRQIEQREAQIEARAAKLDAKAAKEGKGWIGKTIDTQTDD
uniref:hypothetical protein n=1 Tax=Aeromonas lacus TaxID=558884 RepID=UPI00051BFDE9